MTSCKRQVRVKGSGIWVTRDVHHNKYTVIMVQQNLLPQYKYSRDLAINVRYRVIFYNRMTAKQFNNSVREMDKGKNTLKNMYHAMSQPGHPKPLVIDSLTGNTWYGVVPESLTLIINPRTSLIYLKMDQDRQGLCGVCGTCASHAICIYRDS